MTRQLPRHDNPRYGRILIQAFLSLGFLIAVCSADAQTAIAWATRYGAQGVGGNPVSIASDAQGNSYVVGQVDLSGETPHRETLTIKYDPKGNIIWTNWLGSSEHPSQGQAIGLDSDGNVYVLAAIGLTTRPGTTIANSEFAIIKYDSIGARQWVEYVAPMSGGDNFPMKMAVTPAGNVYISGASYPADHASSQVLTMKYDAAGNLLWSHLDPTPGAGINRPSGFGVDATENIYIGVQSSHFYPTIYKLDSAGNLRGSFVSQALDDFDAFHVDALGNIYAAGCYAPGPIVIKWDPNGNEVWRHEVSPSRCFSAIQVDGHGAVSIAETLGSTSTRIAVLKLDANGNLQWENTVASASNDVSEDLDIDSRDQIYLTGFSQGHVSVLKYSPDGQLLWVQQYADGSNIVIPRSATLTIGDSLIIAAESIKSGVPYVESDFITLSVSQSGP